jgi:hypothetical protein
MGTYISHGDILALSHGDNPPPVKVRAPTMHLRGGGPIHRGIPPLKVTGPHHVFRGVAGSWGQRSAMGMNVRHGNIPPTEG